MKKSRLLGFLITFPISIISTALNAALATDAFLNFNSGVPDPSGNSSEQPLSGSYFAMELSINTTVYTTLSQFKPIKLGTIQSASGSHTGLPGGTESPGIDNPWGFFGNTGMHETIAPLTILSDDNNGNVTLDFGGWLMEWNGVDMPLGGSGSFPEDTGIATMTCASSCEVGDSYILDYLAHVPPGNPSGFGGVQYTLYLEGNVSTVPVPPALWLFGSGLLGLVGISRRKKAYRKN
jgi:hypothetical protein